MRYADDFVVLCRSTAEAEEALTLVQQTLTELGLSLSLNKTHITTYAKGYSFLGFVLSSRSRRMRPKSVKKFKDKVRALTCRSHNLDAQVLVELNRVIQGTAQYFATRWFTGREIFHKLDSWIRMRLRCMKTKRLNYEDNRRLRVKWFVRLGLLSLEVNEAMSKNIEPTPRKGPSLWGRPERERRTPGNIGNQPYCDNGEGVAAWPLPYPLKCSARWRERTKRELAPARHFAPLELNGFLYALYINITSLRD